MTPKTHSRALRHLQRWTRVHASRVTDRESVDIHTSDLGLDLPPKALVAACRQLFDDVVHARWRWLDDLLLMMLLPLRNTRAPHLVAPPWDEVPRMLGRTPPGFYLLRHVAYLQFDDAIRVTAPMDPMATNSPHTYAELRCWKSTNRSPSTGWCRDIVILSSKREPAPLTADIPE